MQTAEDVHEATVLRKFFRGENDFPNIKLRENVVLPDSLDRALAELDGKMFSTKDARDLIYAALKQYPCLLVAVPEYGYIEFRGMCGIDDFSFRLISFK